MMHENKQKLPVAKSLKQLLKATYASICFGFGQDLFEPPIAPVESIDPEETFIVCIEDSALVADRRYVGMTMIDPAYKRFKSVSLNVLEVLAYMSEFDDIKDRDTVVFVTDGIGPEAADDLVSNGAIWAIDLRRPDTVEKSWERECSHQATDMMLCLDSFKLRPDAVFSERQKQSRVLARAREEVRSAISELFKAVPMLSAQEDLSLRASLLLGTGAAPMLSAASAGTFPPHLERLVADSIAIGSQPDCAKGFLINLMVQSEDDTGFAESGCLELKDFLDVLVACWKGAMLTNQRNHRETAGVFDSERDIVLGFADAEREIYDTTRKMAEEMGIDIMVKSVMAGVPVEFVASTAAEM